jgi:hypothetical protein
MSGVPLILSLFQNMSFVKSMLLKKFKISILTFTFSIMLSRLFTMDINTTLFQVALKSQPITS